MASCHIGRGRPSSAALTGPPAAFSVSRYVPDCYPRFAAVLLAIAQTLVIGLGLGCGLVRLYRTPDGQ